MDGMEGILELECSCGYVMTWSENLVEIYDYPRCQCGKNDEWVTKSTKKLTD